ncbi:hypothetical protein [Rhodococcus opacus]|uniref:hypothetical protein n=1 Tax=Rhodococcus opacus TaxID=37919 RepID=UPI0006BB4F35|nr:hypothetical protein [Rhodococcus opacus]
MTASLICEDFPTLTGRQEPHNESIFSGDITHGDKSIELARRAGANSMPWQKRAQHGILSMTPAGRWTHPDCCLIIPRQNGKSEILIHRCLYGLFKLGETIIYTAQRWKTARDAWKRMMALIKGRAWLRNRVVRSTCSQGEGIIELASGAVISFGTRSNDTGRGLTEVDLIVYDEAYNLTDGEMSAMAFTQMAAKNPQTIYASSAVNQDEHPNGAVLASVRVRGLNREPALYFAEYMAPEEMPREDEATHQYANPSYGVIQTAEKIQKIMRNLATPAGRKGFDVEALGRGDWPVEKREIHEPVIAAEAWGDMEGSSELVGPIAIAVDRHLDWYSIAMAQRTTSGKIHIEIGYLDRPSTGVVETIAAIVEARDPCVVMMNRTSPATSLNPELKVKRIEPVLSSGQEMAQACVGFLDDALAGQLEHTNDPRLTNSIAGVEKKPMSGGLFGWDYDTAVILSPLVAATLARVGLLTYGVDEPKPVALPPSYVAATGPAEFDALSAGF